MSADNQKTILLVEDEAITVMAEKMTLEKYGYKVIIADTGENAVETVKKTPAIDLILMDINLGAGMDGTEAAAIILRGRDLPVVFLSSHMEPEVVAKTEKITSYGYVVKNSGDTVLQASIKMAFKLFEAKTKEKEKESQKEVALAALQESEEKYRTLVEKANEAISIAQDGVLVFVNRRMYEFLGVPVGALEGKPFIDFVWPEDRELVSANYRKRIAGEPVRDAYDFRIIGAGGVLNWIFLSSAVIQWNGKQATLNLLTDITERKRAEENLRASEEKFHNLFNNSEVGMFRTRLDGSEILEFNEKYLDILNYTREEVTGKPSVNMWANKHEHAKMAQMIKVEGHLTDFECDLLNKQGEVIKCITSLRLYRDTGILEGSIQDITERKQAESQTEAALEALRESEKKLHEAQKLAHIGVWDWKIDTDTVSWTEELYRIAGLDPMLPAPTYAEHSNIYTPESWEVLKTAVERAIKTGEPYQLELKLIRPDGSTRYVNAFGGAKYDANGQVNGLYGSVQDITERKRAEFQREAALEALRESEEKYRILVENSRDIIYTLTTDGVFTFVSPAWTTLLGHSVKQVVGQPFQQFVHPDDLAGCMKLLLKVIETGQRQDGVDAYRVRHADGSWRWHITNAVPIKDATGTVVGGEGIARDITERKQAESQREAALDAMRESEERQQLILATLPIAIFTSPLDPEIDASWVSGDVEKVTGFTVDQYMAEKDFWRNRLHADDRERVLDAYKNPAAGEDIVLEYRWLCKDGHYKWFYDRAIKKRSRQGIQYFGIILDITERKQAESQRKAALEALRESEDRYRDLVENSQDLICTHDLEGKLLSVNEAAARLTGYPIKDLLGMNMANLLDPEVRRIFNAYLKRVRAAGRARGLMRIRTASGEARYWEYDNTLRTKGVTVPVVRGLARDITERKQAEASLKQALNWQQTIFEGSRDAIFISDQDSRFVAVNNAACDLTGYSREQLLKMRIPDIHDLPDLDAYKMYHQRILGGEETLSEAKILRSDSAKIDTEFNNRCVSIAGKLYMHTTARDITERKREESQREAALEALRESEERFRTLYENSTIGIYRTTPDGRIHLANPALVRVLGYSSFADLSTLNLEKNGFESSNPRARFIEIIEKDGEVKGLESAWKRKDGTMIFVRESARAIRDSQAKTLYYDGIVEDITERKRADEEIERQLSEKIILLKEVHHRIKNNIASIGSLLSLHSQSTANPEAIAVLQDAIGRVNSMRILYDKLLLSEDYEDISSKNYLDDLIDTVIAIFPNNAKIKIDKSIADFILDSKRLFPLGIIINELLTNIMKYAFINSDTGLIKISLKNVAKHVTLTIQDNGIGLPAGFDINVPEGFGLKLVKMLIQQLGGSFSIKKHAGTRCKIEFNI